MNNEEKILFENSFTLETKHNNIKKQTIMVNEHSKYE